MSGATSGTTAPPPGAPPVRPAGWKVAVAYGMPNFGLAIMVGPVMGILQGYYAKHFPISLEAIAGVLLLARVFDAVTDPLVGIASDHVRDRFWGRRSWLVVGALLSVLAMYNLLVVPDGVTVGSFRVWILVGFLAWTIAEIPYLAWGTELTGDYDARTRIFSSKTAWGFVGSLIFLALPNLIAFYQARVMGTPEAQITRDYSHLSMKASFWLLAVTTPLFVAIALWACPGGSHARKAERKGLAETARILFSNKAMRIFMGGFVVLGIAGGMQVAMAYLHVSVYLGLGEHVSQIYVVGFLCSLLGVPLWNWLAAAKGKHVSLIAGLSVTCFLFIGLGLLKPHDGVSLLWGKPVVFWYYLLIFCGCNFSQVVFYSMPPAIIGDISEAALLETRKDQSATYYSVYTFLYKMMIGLGQGAALFLSGALFGFDPKAVAQVDKAAIGIKVIMGYLPAVLVVVAVLILTRYPITRRRHLEIQARIKELGLKVEE